MITTDTADYGRSRQIMADHGINGRSTVQRHNGVACVQGPLQEQQEIFPCVYLRVGFGDLIH